jgi:hypothetical protein
MARSPAPQQLIQPARGSIFGELLREVAAADCYPLSSRIRKRFAKSWNRCNLRPSRTSRRSRPASQVRFWRSGKRRPRWSAVPMYANVPLRL